MFGLSSFNALKRPFSGGTFWPKKTCRSPYVKFEATGVENGEVTGSTLYKYAIDHYERDKDGKIIKAVGTHKRLGCISPALAEKLLIGGVPQEVILRFTKGGAE
jgi:hypothetical protein